MVAEKQTRVQLQVHLSGDSNHQRTSQAVKQRSQQGEMIPNYAICLEPRMLLVCVLALCGAADAFFEWMKKAEPVAASPPPVVPTYSTSIPNNAPPFEMSVADEKILAEAKLIDMSPLDRCHFKVVAQLKATCNSLSEEQLAKLGVALFNCQSEVEGRRTFLCTEDFSVMMEGQRELREMTADSLDKLLKGHSALQFQQGALKEGQEQLDASISANLQRLAQEKALISTGQQLVAQLIQGITRRIENVSEQLKGQGTDVQEGHQTILNDLAEVRGRAQEIYSKMELNLNGVLQQQNTTVQFYAELMTKLERMNNTLGYMLTYLDSMQSRLEDRLHVIQGYLGWAGLSLRAVWVCIMHAGYFLFTAVLLSFLQCPTFSRVSLLITVPVNAIAEVNQQTALDLVTLSLLLFALSLGRWFVLQLLWALSNLRGKKCSDVHAALLAPPPLEKSTDKSAKPARSPTTSSTPLKDLDCDLESEVPCLAQDSFMTGDPGIVASSPSHNFGLPTYGRLPVGTPNHSTPRLKSRHTLGGQAVFENITQRNLGGALDVVSQSRSSSPNQSVASNGSFSGRPLCNGTTRLGQPCKKRALAGQDFCRIHEGGHNSYSHL
ncbi:Protein brambleberry [Bagarius yarrelli]|uniref:Protein brambleberry n=1 Tax=Bagarius yarrelli TaxID=175774 RepID=A0A556THR9_BAGYA|nr:Protein brambleberry [Bagarius yarrelli]